MFVCSYVGSHLPEVFLVMDKKKKAAMSDIDFEALVQNVQCKYTYIRRVISQRREVLSTELAGCILLWIFKEYCIDIEW